MKTYDTTIFNQIRDLNAKARELENNSLLIADLLKTRIDLIDQIRKDLIINFDSWFGDLNWTATTGLWSICCVNVSKEFIADLATMGSLENARANRVNEKLNIDGLDMNIYADKGYVSVAIYSSACDDTFDKIKCIISFVKKHKLNCNMSAFKEWADKQKECITLIEDSLKG